MRATTRFLCLSAAAAIAGLAAVDLAYGRYAQKHFLPNMTLQTAEAAGTDCLVTLGDSRMAAGIDASVLRDALHVRGVETCVAPMAVGALPISGQAMALRRFLHDGRKPDWVVLGVSTATLLDEGSPDPGAFFGNRAAELAWSEPSDLFRYYPGFPFADMDSGVRFWFARSNSLSVYASAIWIKTQGLQDRLIRNGPAARRNRFGSIADMHALAGAFREGARKSLAASNGKYRMNVWFQLMQRLTHEAGARLVVIDVPMSSSFRTGLVDSLTGQGYRDWVQSELARSKDIFLDMSTPQSVSDQNFDDGVHLNRAGAIAFSADLGAHLASLLGRQPVEGQPR